MLQWLKHEWNDAKLAVQNCTHLVKPLIYTFLLFAILGFVFADHLSETLLPIIKELIEQTKDLNQWELALFILANNSQSALVGLLGGILYGVLPFIHIAVNGLILGFVFEKTYQLSGIQEWWRILPHGIFELPAIFISLAMGVMLGQVLWQPHDRWQKLKRRLQAALAAYVMIVLPLLVIAAFIESYFPRG